MYQRVLAYFGTNVPIEDLRDDARREEIVKAGVAALEKIDGIKVLNSFTSAVAAVVLITSRDARVAAIRALRALDPPGALGSPEDPNNPLVRGAIGGKDQA